jgi:hypothetical protein
VCLLVVDVSAVRPVGDDWLPIDPSELALKEPKVEKDADAEVLFWEVKVDDSPETEIVTSHHIRLKIFTNRGKDSQSKIDIPYFGYSKVKDIRARTIKPDGTIIDLKKEDVFERTIVKASGSKLKAKSFAMPGLEPGAIIEYKWREVSGGRWANYMRLDFQREIPVHKVTYYVRPARSFYGMRYRPFHVPDSVRFVKANDGFHSVGMTDVPALRVEPRMPPEDVVRSWILIYYTRDNSESTEAYWKDTGKRYHEALKMLSKVNDEVKKASAEIIGDATTPEQKLERLFVYCNTRIKNVYDDASGLTPEQKEKLKENKSPSDTLKRGMGSSADIDLLFAALATAAGFDARLALSADRGKVFFDPSFANSYFVEPSSIAIRVGDTWRFFNPGLTYSPYGMLRWQEEGQEALITDSKEPVWVKTPMSSPDKSNEKRTAKLALSEDGTLEGDVRIEYTGQMAIERKEYNDEDSLSEREETLRSMVKSRMDTAEISNIRIENVQDPAKPFVYEYHVRIPGYAQRTGKRLFLQPAYFQRGIPAVFASSTRKYNVYFHYPWSEQDEVVIKLPAGFALDNADAPSPFNAPNVSNYVVSIGASKDQRTLLYKRSFFFGGNNAILFPADGYEQLRNYFDRLYKADNHAITLKQSATTAQTSTN